MTGILTLLNGVMFLANVILIWRSIGRLRKRMDIISDRVSVAHERMDALFREHDAPGQLLQ